MTLTSTGVGAASGAGLDADTRNARPRFGWLLQAELTKIRSVRSSVWSLVAVVLVTTGIATLATSIYAAQWDSMNDEQRQQVIGDPVGLILQPGSYYGQIAICVLGVMVIASEYSTGMIRASLLAVPKRTPMLAAKVLVLVGVLLVVGELVAFLSFLIGASTLGSKVDVTLADPHQLRAVVGLGLYLVVVGLFAVALGTIIRHVAGAITTAIGAFVVLPSLLSLIPGDAGRYVSTYMPGGSAGQLILSSGPVPDALLGPWQGYFVSLGWAGVLLALAVLVLNRRDA